MRPSCVKIRNLQYEQLEKAGAKRRAAILCDRGPKSNAVDYQVLVRMSEIVRP